MAEGPTRFVGNTPYFDVTTTDVLEPGPHTVCIHAHSAGVQTRILLLNAPQVWCEMTSTNPVGAPISDITATCIPLPGYTKQWHRMSPLLGWMENLAVAQHADAWLATAFDDSSWHPVAPAKAPLNPPVPMLSAPATSLTAPLSLIASGQLWERCVDHALEPPDFF